MPPRRSPLPRVADISFGDGAALPSRTGFDTRSEFHYKTNVYQRDSRAALAAYHAIRARGAHRPDAGRRSPATEELREAALLALTAALSAGDDNHVIEILWELHRKDVFRYCRRMLDNDAEAADVTQKVFENAIMGLDRLRSVDSPRRWLIGIARHRCLDHARSARRAPRLVDAHALSQFASPSFIAEAGDEDPRTVRLVAECLERLEACDRTLIELRFYKELPFKEIARLLGRTPAALRVRLTRACRLLRRYLNTRLANRSSDRSAQAVMRPRYLPTSHLTTRLASSNGQPCPARDSVVQVS
jgi:RNA polymerase sigma-70 factor (ECF subfamily)